MLYFLTEYQGQKKCLKDGFSRTVVFSPLSINSVLSCSRRVYFCLPMSHRDGLRYCGSTYVHRPELGDVVGNETGSGEYRRAVRRGHASGLVRRPGQYRHGSRTEEARSRTSSCATRRRTRTTSWSARLAGPPAIHRNERTTCVVGEVNCST